MHQPQSTATKCAGFQHILYLLQHALQSAKYFSPQRIFKLHSKQAVVVNFFGIPIFRPQQLKTHTCFTFYMFPKSGHRSGVGNRIITCPKNINRERHLRIGATGHTFAIKFWIKIMVWLGTPGPPLFDDPTRKVFHNFKSFGCNIPPKRNADRGKKIKEIVTL